MLFPLFGGICKNTLLPLKMVHKDTNYSLKVRDENFCNTTQKGFTYNATLMKAAHNNSTTKAGMPNRM